MIARAARRRLRPGPLALLAGAAAAGLAGPALLGPADVPAVGAAESQLLPPGAVVMEAALPGGGLVRAPRIDRGPAGLLLSGRAGTRALPGVALARPPSLRRLWLGSDRQGRDLAARLARALRTSIAVATLAALVALGLGTAVGLLGAFGGRGAALAAGSVTDALLGLPRLLLLLALGVALRDRPGGVALAIGLASFMEPARLVWGEAERIAGRAHVLSARAAGAGPLGIASRHVLPGLAPVIGAAVPLAVTQAILLEATLSFLGAGVTSGSASLGRIVAESRRMLPEGWWMLVFPGLLLVLVAQAVQAIARRPDPGLTDR